MFPGRASGHDGMILASQQGVCFAGRPRPRFDLTADRFPFIDFSFSADRLPALCRPIKSGLTAPPRVVTLRLAKHRSVVPSVGLPTQYKTSLEGIGRTQQLTDGCLATSPATNFGRRGSSREGEVADEKFGNFNAPVDSGLRRQFDTNLCLLFIHPRALNLISLRSAGTMPA